jgi:hypothetical protein
MGSNRFESAIDKQIREAQERGDFDNLPGAGKPLPDDGELYDENWWLKKLVVRENIGGAPASLKIKRAAEELTETVDAEWSEAKVRKIVIDLNERIDQANRGLLDGPPVVLKQFDVDEVVAQWRERRRSP